MQKISARSICAIREYCAVQLPGKGIRANIGLHGTMKGILPGHRANR
jgi:hypothetical protein